MCKSQIFTIYKFEMGAVLRTSALLLLICTPTLSFALGLGEISLKSNLGESLLAKIALTDVDSAPDSNCFSVADISDTPAFKKANITLQSTNGNYQLNINTHDAITEPIINLRVTLHCEPNLNRDYVLLLDPASLTSPDSPAVAPQPATVSNMPAVNDKSQHRKSNQQVVPQNTTDPSPDNTINNDSYKKNKLKKKTKKKLSAEATADIKLLEAYTGKQARENSTQPATENKAGLQSADKQDSTGKPRLILSNGGMDSTGSEKNPSLSLRLETQIDFTRAEVVAPLSSADTADEVTMMTNRLAHLEKQIVSLQSQNERLRNEANKNKDSAAVIDLWPNWLPSIPIALSILSALVGIFWLRRKILTKRLLNEQASWFDADNEHSSDSANHILNSDTAIFDKIKPKLPTNSNANNGDISNQSGFFSYPSAYTVDDNDISESVLDHSDVFIAHDRPAMAIQLLQNHLIDSPVESPEIWLKLLSLLATEGTETEYDNAVIACKKFFNIKLPSFADASIADNSTIEDYPHILARLQDVWGSEFAVEFLNDLIFNRQSQPREGFGRSTFEELFFLNQIAISLHSTSKFNKRAEIKETPKTQPALEIASVEQIMQDYGMSVDIEPQDKIRPPKTNNIFEDELTAESFFNAPDAEEDDLDINSNAKPNAVQSANRNNSQQDSALDFGLDMSFGAEERSELEAKFKTTEAKPHLNSPTLEINMPLNSMEDDFAGDLDEISIEAPADASLPETNFPEIKFGTDDQVLAEDNQDLTIELTEEHVQEKSSEPLNTPHMIEWEQPELEPKSETVPRKTSKTKKDPLA